MTTPQPVESSLVQQHKAFKDNAVNVLHQVGDQHRWCSIFDSILVDLGLPGRDSFHDDRDADDRPDLVGEKAVEQFEAWKHDLARKIYEIARRHAINDPDVDEVMGRIGFPARSAFYRTVTLTANGTFSVPLGTREVAVTEDVIEHVDRYQVADALHRGIYTDSDDITWKVVVDE